MCETILMAWVFIGLFAGILAVAAATADWLERQTWFIHWHMRRHYKPMATKRGNKQ